MLVPITLFLLFSTVSGKVCDRDQFWSKSSQGCEECKECIPPDIVLTPCQDHRDTHCGPISQLKIDWSWMKQNHLKSKKQKDMTDTFKENMPGIALHEKHMKEKQDRMRKLLKEGDDSSSDESDISREEVWQHLKQLKRDSVSDDLTAIEQQNKPYNLPFDLEPGRVLHFTNKEVERLLKSLHKEPNELEYGDKPLKRNYEVIQHEQESYQNMVPVEEDFSSAERFVLDWQTVILGLAVASCVTFFLVALAYAVLQCRQWKSVRRYFYSDSEQLKAWLAPKSKHMPNSGIYKTTTEVIHNEGKGRSYFERIVHQNVKPKMVYTKPLVRPIAEELKPLNDSFVERV